MSVKMRQIVEREMVEAVIDDLLATGFKIAIDNGGDDYEVDFTSNRKKLVEGIMATDEERLYVSRNGKNAVGWVYFIYGEDGWDVMNDYTVNLEPYFKKMKEVFKKYAPDGYDWE